MIRSKLFNESKGTKCSLSDFDEKEVAMGLRVESEHNLDKKVIEGIVIDHLIENPKYYSKLKEAGLAEEIKEAILQDLQLLEVLDIYDISLLNKAGTKLRQTGIRVGRQVRADLDMLARAKVEREAGKKTIAVPQELSNEEKK